MIPSCLEIVVIGCILALPFFYETSGTFRYYFKFFVYYGLMMSYSVILVPIMAFRPYDVKNLLMASKFCQHISMLIGIKWDIRGHEILAQDQACIVIANHQSSLDVLGIFEVMPLVEKCTIVCKKELKYFWPFGLAGLLCGLTFIDRMNSEQAKTQLNNTAEDIKGNKVKLWVFPEGKRHNTGELHEFKKGAFHIAITSQLPIVPVVNSTYHFLSSKEKRFDSGNVIISVLPPISTTGLSLADMESLMEKTKKLMTDELHSINRDIIANIKQPCVQ